MQNLIFLFKMRKKNRYFMKVKQVKKKSTKLSFLYQNVGVNKKKVTKILNQFTNYSREFSIKSILGIPT